MLALVVESWIWYGIAITITVFRFVSRGLLFGSVLRLKIDDWLMTFAICTYTTLLVCINIVATKNSNLLPAGVSVADMSPAEKRDRVFGSKLVFVVELMQCCTIWLLKSTLIIMYWRITRNLPQHIWVKLLAVYVGVTFVVMEILYLGVWCQPISNYWALPTPNKQCSAATNHLITNAVFNLSSDLAMLAIGFSLAIKSKLPWKRKIIVHAIFAIGIFVIVASILNKYYSFTNPYGSLWTYWYVREASTAMIVANLPFCWTLVRKVFNVGSFNGEKSSDLQYHSAPSGRSGPDHRSSFLTNPEDIEQGNKQSDESTESGSQPTERRSSIDWRRSRNAQAPLERNGTDYTHAAVNAPKPCAKRWKDRGVFGKDDVEAFGSDLEDSDDELRDRLARISDASRRRQTSYFPDLVLNDVGNLGQPARSPSSAHPPEMHSST